MRYSKVSKKLNVYVCTFFFSSRGSSPTALKSLNEQTTIVSALVVGHNLILGGAVVH